MAAEYDQTILSHYDAVAERFGASPASTMEDEIVRKTEMEIISRLVDLVSRRVRERQHRPTLRVIDVGCGNGYTLSRLAERTAHEFVGIEYNDRLRAIAIERLKPFTNVRVIAGDVRNPKLASHLDATLDLLICQRVLINLLDPADQKRALDNIIHLVAPGGILVFIECFASALANLNAARAEFEMLPIPPAPHNLYLPDGFFESTSLEVFSDPDWDISACHLSTHYFATRVLHPIVLKSVGAPFERNSHFTKFFSAALAPAIGDYAPLKISVLSRR